MKNVSTAFGGAFCGSVQPEKKVKLKGISFHATVDDDTHSACRIVLFTFPVRARLFCLISRANDACLKERITTDQPLTEGNTKLAIINMEYCRVKHESIEWIFGVMSLLNYY